MKIHRSYMIFAYMSLLVMGVSDNIRGPIFPDMIKEFNLSQNRASLFFSVSSAMNILGGYLSPLLLKYIGRMRTLQLSHLVLSLAFLGVWLATDFNMILVSMFFYGTAIGVMGVAQNVLVVEASPLQEQQKWLSGFQSMYGLASLAAPILVIFARQYNPTWQFSFLINALIGFILLSFSLYGKDKVQHEYEEHHENSKPGHLELYFYGLIFAVYVATEVMVTTRLAQYVRDGAGWSLESASSLNSLFFVGMFLGRFLFIFWRPPISLKTQMIASVGVGSLAIVAGVFINPYAFILSGLSLAPFYPLCITAAAKMFKSDLGRVSAYAMGLTGIVIVMMQTTVGFISQSFGLKAGLMVGPFFGLVTILLLVSYSQFFKREIP